MTAKLAEPDYRKYAVLYVDDEEQALKYFRKALEKEFTVLTATSVAEAAQVLERQGTGIGVVLTDQRMPGQYGVELLKLVRAKWPGIIRLLITAYSDMESAIEAVNSGAIYKYVTKPCDLKALKEIVKDAMGLFLAGVDRQTLLTERIEVMQRMVVADRVRSLAAMAGGISHHLRNSMTALTCFLEELAPEKAGESPMAAIARDPKYAEQLWALAHKERDHLLRIVENVGETIAEPMLKIADDVDPAELVAGGITAAAAELGGRAVQFTPPATALPKLKLDASAATRVIRILLTYAGRLSPAPASLSVCIEPLGGPDAGATFKITTGGTAWQAEDVDAFFTPFTFTTNDPSDLGLDLMSAFSIAFHHNGDVLVHAAAPAGPGFELRLPAAPADVRRPAIQDGMMQKLIAPNTAPAPLPTPGERAA